MHGVILGGFSGFSEYHTAPAGVSAVESRFLAGYALTAEGDVLDVGANLGLFSLLIGKWDPARRVFALEPSPSTFASLKENVALNCRENISCFHIAIAAHDGTVRFASREHARARASIAAAGMEWTDTVQVACETIDTFCRRHGIDRIAILKVDVEGYETLVFRGASRVLSVARPELIYFEVCPELARGAGFEAAEPARLLAASGYQLMRFGADGAITPASPEAASKVELYENWIAIPKT